MRYGARLGTGHQGSRARRATASTDLRHAACAPAEERRRRRRGNRRGGLEANDALCGVEDGRAASAIDDLRTRDLLGRQRTQLVNVLRGLLAEHGIVAAHGLAQVKVLATAMRDTGSLHPLVCELGQRYLDHIGRLDVEIAELDKRLRRSCKDDETAKRLQSMPGMGPITAAAIEACAPPMPTFKRARDLQARPRLCRLARSRSAATYDWREAEAGADGKDGAARHPAASRVR